MLALTLNNANLPYPDAIHPIIVHFVITAVFFSVFCDVVGYLTRKHHFFEVSFWNLLVAALFIFLAIIVGQFEAGLAEPYAAAKPTLNLHTITGWSLAPILTAIVAWRFVIRNRNPLKVPLLILELQRR